MFASFETTASPEEVECSLFDPNKFSIPKENIELQWYDETNISIASLEIMGDIRKAVPQLATGFTFSLSGTQGLRDFLEDECLKYGASIEWKDGTLEGILKKPVGRELTLQRFMSWVEDSFGGLVSVNTKGTYYVFQQGAKTSRNRKNKKRAKSSSFWVGAEKNDDPSKAKPNEVQGSFKKGKYELMAQRAARAKLYELELLAQEAENEKHEELAALAKAKAEEELESMATELSKSLSEEEEEPVVPAAKRNKIKRWMKKIAKLKRQGKGFPQLQLSPSRLLHLSPSRIVPLLQRSPSRMAGVSELGEF